MRCPHCGAHNPARAAWCGQCLTSFAGPPDAGAGSRDIGTGPRDAGTAPRDATGEPGAPADAAPRDAARGTVARSAEASPSDRAGREAGVVATSRDVRERDGEVEWRCAACEGWSPLLVQACVTCGAARTGFGDPPPRDEATDETRLLVLTGLLPGLGHAQAGRTGTGIARAVVALAWLVGGVALGAGALRTGRVPLSAAPLLLGAAAVWGASLHDVRGLAHDGRQLLDPRGLLWLVAAVTGLLVVALLFETFRLVGG